MMILNLKNPFVSVFYTTIFQRFKGSIVKPLNDMVIESAVAEICMPCFNPFKPEFTIVIFIHYKPRIAVAILDL